MSTELLKATLGKFNEMHQELESLRQENSRLREENHRLKVHLCIGTDALKEPTDMYEVVRKNELHRLREELKQKEDESEVIQLRGAKFQLHIILDQKEAELKRLREELERKESALKGAVFSNADMDAEVKRLREALERIANTPVFSALGAQVNAFTAQKALNPPVRDILRKAVL